MIRKSRILKKIFAAGLVISLLGGIGVQAETSLAGEIRLRLMQFYKDGVPFSVFETESVDEIIEIIDDKYTVYMDPEESRIFQNGINRKFYGLGVFIKEHKDGILITEVMKDGPSGNSGLQAGDIIIKVDDKNIKGMELEESRPLIVGEKDTKVKITVDREGDIKEFTITRGEVRTPTVEYEWLNEGTTAHVIIRSFGETSFQEFYDIIKECKESNVKNFIVDLRQNPGGYMNQALNIAGLFIGDNTAIYTSSKTEKLAPVPGVESDMIITEPVTVLINENSASASEILAGAIKEYDAALVVGENTYGKGVAQGMINLSDGGVLKVTVKEFFSPGYRKINEIGIKPHIEIKDVNPLILAEIFMDSRDRYNMFYEDTENEEVKVIEFNREWAFIDKIMNGWELNLNMLEQGEINSDEAIRISVDSDYNSDLEDAKENIELINGISGKRVEYNLKYTDGELIVEPKENLVQGLSYVLVMKPKLKTQCGFLIKEGTMQIIKVK